MARTCPRCDNEPLRPLRVSGVAVDTCPRCHGLWFARGTLERFPGRPPVRGFLSAARGASSGCRKDDHLVPPEHERCARCGSTPLRCPDCGSRLARVVTSACAVDVCPPCEGLWLEAQGFALLEGVTNTQARPANRGTARVSLVCSACGVGLEGRDAFSYQGDVYCPRCRPPSAVPHPGAPR